MKEGLEVLLPILSHALAKLKGDPTECGKGPALKVLISYSTKGAK
ncbi:MAG: hypothetical protein KIIPBIDF_01899 [Candidatus Methanoperedenaceae archaeon GB50]|nr:MAG: hypothetical protein KIIPBIDF_01899 [Candidatus Methanoperedenaceae archaeon GB50]